MRISCSLRRLLWEESEDQRAAVQQMMGQGIRYFESLLNSGAMQITTQVKELKVNTGPPNTDSGQA